MGAGASRAKSELSEVPTVEELLSWKLQLQQKEPVSTLLSRFPTVSETYCSPHVAAGWAEESGDGRQSGYFILSAKNFSAGALAYSCSSVEVVQHIREELESQVCLAKSVTELARVLESAIARIDQRSVGEGQVTVEPLPEAIVFCMVHFPRDYVGLVYTMTSGIRGYHFNSDKKAWFIISDLPDAPPLSPPTRFKSAFVGCHRDDIIIFMDGHLGSLIDEAPIIDDRAARIAAQKRQESALIRKWRTVIDGAVFVDLPSLTQMGGVIQHLQRFQAAALPGGPTAPPPASCILSLSARVLPQSQLPKQWPYITQRPCDLPYMRLPHPARNTSLSVLLRSHLRPELVSEQVHIAGQKVSPSPAQALLPCPPHQDHPFTAGGLGATYPFYKDPATGEEQCINHPIADAYCIFKCFSSSVSWVVGCHLDGCGTGHAAWHAAHCVMAEAQRVVSSGDVAIETTHEAALLLAKMMYIGHNKCLEVDEASSCTAAVYTLLPTSPQHYVLVYAMAGDVDGYHYNTNKKCWCSLNAPPLDLRTNAQPEGGLGKYFGERDQLGPVNSIYYGMMQCQLDDVILFFSDGIGDCLDPLQSGVPPRCLGLGQYKTWEEFIEKQKLVPGGVQEAIRVMHSLKLKQLSNVLWSVCGPDPHTGLQSIVSRLMDYCQEVTRGERSMFDNPRYRSADRATKQRMYEEARLAAWEQNNFCWAKIDHVSVSAFTPRCLQSEGMPKT